YPEGISMLRSCSSRITIVIAIVCILTGCNSEAPPAATFTVAGPHALNGLTYSPDGKYLAGWSKRLSLEAPGYWQGNVTVWEAASKKRVGSLDQSGWVHSVAFLDDSKQLAVAFGSYNWPDPALAQRLGYVSKPSGVVIYEMPSLKMKAQLKDDERVFV